MKKWRKWIGRILLGLLLLLLLLVLLIHTAPVKNFIRGKLEAFLRNKTQSEIHIGAVNYRLPKWVEIDGVFFRDKAGDTLLYGDKLRVDVNMLKLLKGQYEISRIELGSIMVNISRKPNDSTFNYQYLIDAFKSKTPDPEPKKESTISLSLDQLAIAKSSIRWNDQYGGTIMTTRIGDLRANIDSLDLFKQKYALSKFDIADMFFDLQLLTTGHHSSDAIAVSDSAKESILPSILIGKMAIARSHFAFYGQASGLRTVNDINEFNLNGLAVAAPQKISLDKVELNNSSLLLDRNVIEKAVDKIKQIDTVTSALAITVKEARFSNNNIAYNNPDAKAVAKGFDANHVNLLRFNAGLKDMGYGDNTIKARIDSLSFKERSGLSIDSMHGDFTMDDTTIVARNLLLKTPLSSIAGEALVFPASIDEKYRGNQQNRLVFANNVIARKDLQLLAPSIMDKYDAQLRGVNFIYITADLTGNAKRAAIKTIALRSDRNDIVLNAGGTVSNALSKDALMYDLSIAKLTATKGFVEPFVNTKGKQTVNLPPVINATGKLSGDMRQVNTDLVVTSAYGQAAFKGQIRNFTNPGKLGYDMRLVAKELETGKWINRDSMLGKLNGNILVKGNGIDYKTASIESLIDISSFRLQEHVYTGINFNINGTNGSYDVKGKVADSLLRVNMNVKTNLNQQYPSVVGKVDVFNADLYALGFVKEPLRFRSMMDVQAKDLSPQTLNAAVRLDSTVVYQKDRTIKVDSITAKGSIDSGKTLIAVNAPFADAKVKGEYRYDELPGILQNYVARYTKGATAAAAPANASFTMDADLKPDPVYALLLPGLFFDKNIHATAKLDTKQKDSSLVFYLTAPVIVYGSNRLSNLDIRAAGANDSIRYAIVLDTARASSIQLFSTAVTGGIGKGAITANIVTKDTDNKDKYALSVSALMENDAYKIHLGNRLKINYADWNVDEKNVITYGKQGVNVSQFNITKGTESIAINSATAAPNAPIDVKIDKFSLQNITGLMDRDSLEIAGMLNVQVKVDGLDKTIPLFSGNLKVDSLAYQGIPVGNLAVNASSDNSQAVNFDGKLTGNSNNVDLKGTYNQDKIDAQVVLQPMELKTIEPFTQKNLARSTGKVSGNITISGSVKQPEWNGSLRFDSASTTLAQFGTLLKLDNQQIVMKYPQISFNQFTIRDSLNHPLTINGTVTQGNKGFVTDLTVKTKNFTALDNTPVANNQIYGKAIVDVDVVVTGPAAAPDISGDVGLKEQSSVTFVRQQKVSSAKDREGVMEFVDVDTVKNLVFRPADTTLIARSRQDMASLNYNLNIDIDKDAKFAIIIDPLTRDELQVQGAGQLNAAVNPNGDISLTGAYNLSKGSYQLNYKFLKRRFELQEGSTIVLSGDPKNAEANITAIYEIEASPYDLLANEVSDVSNPAIYRQKIPFEVVLKIKGRAMEPELTFDVQLKDKVSGVNSDMASTIDNKLLQMRSDPSTMNKQVFALLVMGRFIGEQSKDFFGSSSSDGLKADQVVKESVGRFLADAVSQVAADLIKGVEVDVDLKTVDNYTDATQRTDLNLALSKRFLNDRLSLTVGKNFTVEGEDPLAKGQDNSNVAFLPDITTTYKLSKDGRYMVKAYQKSDYEAILDGYFIETGVAFTLNMDYDQFKELFKKTRKTKEQREQEKKQNERKKEKQKEDERKIEEEQKEKNKSANQTGDTKNQDEK